MQEHFSKLFSTYSIVARDAETGELGVTVQTHQMCVGWVVPWLRPALGLDLLEEGVSPEHVIAALVASDPGAARRQVAVVDAQGRAAAFTGEKCIAEASHHVGEGYSVQANMMTRPMVHAYESATGDLAARMMAALEAAQVEDGDIRGMQSAALKIVSGDRATPVWDTIYDLRVDESETPLDELSRLVRLRRAAVIDERGFEALSAGKRDEAFALWQQARELAPEMEEIPFWQAMNAADELGDVAQAVALLRAAFEGHPRRAEWVDLIRRLEACGMLTRGGIANEIITRLGW